MTGPAPGAARRRVIAYLQAEMGARCLRRTDPSAVARMILGTAQNHVSFERVDGLQRPEGFVPGVIDARWLGVAPEARQESTEA